MILATICYVTYIVHYLNLKLIQGHNLPTGENRCCKFTTSKTKVPIMGDQIFLIIFIHIFQEAYQRLTQNISLCANFCRAARSCRLWKYHVELSKHQSPSTARLNSESQCFFIDISLCMLVIPRVEIDFRLFHL